MIKKGQFKNIFGLKEFEIDFTQKHTYGKGQEDQILNHDMESVSLIPTILAKNAAGKTSLIKAIDLALRFSNKETFIAMVNRMKIETIILERNEDSHKFGDTDEIEMKIFEKNYTKQVISNLFTQISFAGAEYSEIILDTIHGDNIKIESSPEAFIIQLNNETIDLTTILENIVLNKEELKTPMSARRAIKEKLNKITSTIKFLSNTKNYSSLFRDTRPGTELSELSVKYKTRKHIQNIIDTLGFDALQILLKKLDKNIKKITFNQEDKEFEIFINNSDVPISSVNLSFGTQKILEVLNNSIPLFENGGIMMIDEIENGLHLSLIQMIVSIFEDSEINTGKAQLLLTTHNPLLGENGIVFKSNFIMFEEGEFINIKKIAKRTSDQEQIIKNKNYFNDIYWQRKSLEEKSTLSYIAINQILNAFQKGISEV